MTARFNGLSPPYLGQCISPCVRRANMGHPNHLDLPRPSFSPQLVLDRAESCLRHNPYLALKNVECAFCDGVLTLRGYLQTYYLSQMAQEAVGRVGGVHRVVNEIEVLGGARR